MTQDLSFWKKWTQARIGLGHVGHSIPTEELLDFKWAHASARDAVLKAWDVNSSKEQLQQMGCSHETLTSQTQSREEFLRRPDLGRTLSQESKHFLQQKHHRNDFDLCLIASDGLSALAIEEHLTPFLRILQEDLRALQHKISPIFLVPYGRVAISDEIGFFTHSKISILMIGERPGLSAPNSMGIYLTYSPQAGNTDSLRNCLSNIRPPFGLSYEDASRKLLFLIRESLRLKLSGVSLKESDSLLS